MNKNLDDMIFSRNNGDIMYCVRSIGNNILFDMYNLATMNFTPGAVKSLIESNIRHQNLNTDKIELNSPYQLTLDLLGNSSTPLIDTVINKVITYFEGYKTNMTVSPLKLTIQELHFDKILETTRSGAFQAINTEINTLHLSTWVVRKV